MTSGSRSTACWNAYLLPFRCELVGQTDRSQPRSSVASSTPVRERGAGRQAALQEDDADAGFRSLAGRVRDADVRDRFGVLLDESPCFVERGRGQFLRTARRRPGAPSADVVSSLADDAEAVVPAVTSSPAASSTASRVRVRGAVIVRLSITDVGSEMEARRMTPHRKGATALNPLVRDSPK